MGFFHGICSCKETPCKIAHVGIFVWILYIIGVFDGMKLRFNEDFYRKSTEIVVLRGSSWGLSGLKYL